MTNLVPLFTIKAKYVKNATFNHVLYQMVIHLLLRTHELLYKEICNIITEIL